MIRNWKKIKYYKNKSIYLLSKVFFLPIVCRSLWSLIILILSKQIILS